MGASGRGAASAGVPNAARNVLTATLSDGNTLADYQGGVGFTVATGCSAWANQIGAFGPLAQGTGSKQPVISGNSLISDGIDDFMSVTATFNQPLTTYTVYRGISYASNPVVLSGVVAEVDMPFFKVNQDSAIYAGSVVAAITPPAANTYFIHTCVINGASSSNRINLAGAVTGNAGANNPGGITMAALLGGAAQFFNGQYQEIIARSVADSTATQNTIIALLQSIWGTP